MKIEFIKEHKVGIKLGHIVGVDDNFGERMIKEGYAIEVKDVKKPSPKVEKLDIVEDLETSKEVEIKSKVEKTEIVKKIPRKRVSKK
jgi:hypothetical protein